MNMFSIWCVNAVQRKVTVPCAPSQGRSRKLARHADALLLSRRLKIHSLSPLYPGPWLGVKWHQSRNKGVMAQCSCPSTGLTTPQLLGRVWVR